jgi:hypothetical protein
MRKAKRIGFAIIIALFGCAAYLFLFGKLFPYSPFLLGFNKIERTNTILYVQNGATFHDFSTIDTLISSVENFHELKFIKKPGIFIFRDSLSYIQHSPSNARFCAFSTNRLFISPWALREAREGKISLSIYVSHELSHVLIFQHKGFMAELHYPAWLLEGIAMYSAKQMGTSFYPGKEESYHCMAQGNFLPPFDYKTKREERAKIDVKYRIGFIYSEFAYIVDYLVEKCGKDKLLRYMKGLISDNDHDKIFRQVYGTDFDSEMGEFRRFVLQNDRGAK